MKKLIFFMILLFASPVFAMDVTLEWDANTEPDLAGYSIYQAVMISGTQTSPFELVDEVESSVTTYTITGLEDTVYIFQVYAFDTQGNRSLGSNFVFSIDRMAPGAPQNVR